MAEWSKALAWKVSIRQNRIEGSNPSRSAIYALQAMSIIAMDCRNSLKNLSFSGEGMSAVFRHAQRSRGTLGGTELQHGGIGLLRGSGVDAE